MTKVLPESDNAELAGLNPAHVGDADATLRTVVHIPVQAASIVRRRLGKHSCRLS
jgi:hypothetical protein